MTHHVVVVGAGFAGLQLVKGLAGAGCRITLIDQRNHHLFQPLLYQVATTLLSTSEIAWPIRRVLRNRPDVTTLLARVTGVDRVTQRVTLENGTTVSYDTLVLATGARHAYFGHDEWEADAPGLKTLEDATTIRRRLLLAFERAEIASDPAERDANLTFAIIGGGPTGVELAGIVADLAHRVLPREFRAIDTRTARIMLIEAGPRILPAFGERLSDYARKALEGRGVEVLTGTPVTDVSPAGIVLGDRPIAARTVIWAAGVQASRAQGWLEAPADRAGRVMVTPMLTLPDDPNIFVLGDTAHVESDGKPVPGVAPAAKQQGRHAARIIRARLRGAVTGSVGKTSVTQAIKAGLDLAGSAHASIKSYNNHIGVPLTLARMPVETQRAVMQEIIASARASGIEASELTHLLNTEPLMRNAAFQRMMYDAGKYRLMMKAKDSVTTRPLPPVQRPGSAASRGERENADLRTLNARLSSTGDIKDAVALYHARKAIRR